MGNKGYRKYLSAEGPKFTINEAKVKTDERFDRKWVLQTDREDLTAEEVALQYKQLWTVKIYQPDHASSALLYQLAA